MSFFRSILLFAGVVCAVLVPMFVGHGLATGGTAPYLAGAGLLVAAVVLLFLLKITGARESTVD